MSLLNRDALLAAALVLPTERVETPELGQDAYVIVRGLSASQRDAYEKAMWTQRGAKRVITDNVRAKLIVRCLIDEQGNLQYTDADIAGLGKLRADILERVFDACRRLSGMTEVEVEEKKEPSDQADSSDSPTS